jgi:hypothetical protein
LLETGIFGEVNGFGARRAEDLMGLGCVLFGNLQPQAAEEVRISPVHADHIFVFE